jgi:hypothetical protein
MEYIQYNGLKNLKICIHSMFTLIYVFVVEKFNIAVGSTKTKRKEKKIIINSSNIKVISRKENK